MSRGYGGVTLRDIADALSIRQASLYYHAPGGKEDLYVRVVERRLDRAHAQIQTALADAGTDLEASLRAVGRVRLGGGPMDLFGMIRADLPALSEAAAVPLLERMGAVFYWPVVGVITAAVVGGGLRPGLDPDVHAGLFLSLLEGIALTPHFGEDATAVFDPFLDAAVSLFLGGVLASRPDER